MKVSDVPHVDAAEVRSCIERIDMVLGEIKLSGHSTEALFVALGMLQQRMTALRPDFAMYCELGARFEAEKA